MLSSLAANSLFTPTSLADSVALNASANGLSKVAGVLRGVLLTWFMVPSEFGIFQFAFLLSNLLLPIVSCGTYEGVARWVPHHETSGQLWAFIRRASVTTLIIGGAWCTVLTFTNERFGMHRLLISQTGETSASTISTAQWLPWCVLSMLCYHWTLAAIRGRRMFRAHSAMELLAGLGFALSAVLLAILGFGQANTILAVYTASNLLCAGLFAIPFLWITYTDSTQSKALDEPRALRDFLGYSIWAGWSALSWQLLLSVPSWFLYERCGEKMFASWRAGQLFTQIGLLGPLVLSVAVSSTVTKLWEAVDKTRAVSLLNTCTKMTFVAMVLLCAVLSTLKGVLGLLLGHEYRDALSLFPLLFVLYLLAGVLTFLHVRFSLVTQARNMFVCWTAGWLAALLASAMIIDSDSAESLRLTAWSSVCGILIALLTALFLLHRTPVRPDRGTYLTIAAIFLILLKPLYVLAGCSMMIGLAVGTPVIFNKQDRTVIDDLVERYRKRRSQDDVP